MDKEVNSRSRQRRIALQKGEPMPTFEPAPPDLLLTDDRFIEVDFVQRESECSCGMCHFPEGSTLLYFFHEASPHVLHLGAGVCNWHKQHGNEGLRYILVPKAQLAHSQPLIEQKVRREIGEWVFQFFASHASSVLFDGEKYHEQSTIETITVFGGKDRKTPCYRYRIEASLLEKFKEAIQSGEPLEGGKG